VLLLLETLEPQATVRSGEGRGSITTNGLLIGCILPVILLGAISCVALARGWRLCRLDRMPAWRVSRAATDWLLFSYSTLCSITLRLLHCVPIGGGGSYLFLNGATGVKIGDKLRVKIGHADEYDLWGEVE
jgi:hypothetical protein